MPLISCCPIVREPFEIDEPGVKLKSALLAASKPGYVNCKEVLQVLLQSMTTRMAAEASCRIENLLAWLMLGTAMACKLFLWHRQVTPLILL